VISKRAATKDFLTIEIDVYSKLLRELKGTSVEERARKEFIAIAENYPGVIDPAEIDKKVDAYLRANVVKLYEVDRVNFYILETGNDGAISKVPRPVIQLKEIDGQNQTYGEKDLYAAGYKLKKDVKTNIQSDLKIQIQIALDSRYYTSVGFGIDISRI
jgi:hypothetical protein